MFVTKYKYKSNAKQDWVVKLCRCRCLNDQASNCLNSLLKRYESMSENSQLSSGSKEDPLNNDIS